MEQDYIKGLLWYAITAISIILGLAVWAGYFA